jgi:hypothetical protein
MIKKNIDVFLSSEASITVEKIESNNTFSEVDLSIYKGKDGYTPIKGIDYFTEEDIESLKEIFALKDHTHDNMGSATKAICGTFKAGELKVGQGLDNKSSKNNPKWIDNVTPVNAVNLNEIEDKLKAHQEALDELLYVPLTINLTSNIQTTLEIGTTINSVVFNWSYNKDIVSQKFNNQALEASLRTYTYNLPFNSNKSFKLEANDGKGDFNKSISFNFLNGRYWGVSSSNIYNSDFIKTLSKELSSSKGKTFTVNCGEGQFIFYCVPTRFGNCSFKVGGFEGGFNKVNTIEFTNASGYVESYDIYKSTNSNLGNTTVVVS